MAPVINVVMMPILLLSGILLPMTIGADWLKRISDFMPFRYIVDAVRDVFAGDFGGSAVAWGTGWALVLFALAMWWGTSVFRKETA
jgi:ABC-2 type transport system permease protein